MVQPLLQAAASRPTWSNPLGCWKIPPAWSLFSLAPSCETKIASSCILSSSEPALSLSRTARRKEYLIHFLKTIYFWQRLLLWLLAVAQRQLLISETSFSALMSRIMSFRGIFPNSSGKFNLSGEPFNLRLPAKVLYSQWLLGMFVFLVPSTV